MPWDCSCSSELERPLGLIAVSDPLIAVIYGPGWDKAATIFRWLAVSFRRDTDECVWMALYFLGEDPPNVRLESDLCAHHRSRLSAGHSVWRSRDSSLLRHYHEPAAASCFAFACRGAP